MSKAKSQSNTKPNTKESRGEAEQFFVKGSCVCNRLTGKTGVFTGIDEGSVTAT